MTHRAQDQRGQGEKTDCHTSDIGHWFAMTRDGPPGASAPTLWTGEDGPPLCRSGGESPEEAGSGDPRNYHFMVDKPEQPPV